MEPELHEKDEVREEQYSVEEDEEEPNEFQLLEVLDLQQVFPTEPFETDCEVLDSGVTYYVKRSANTNDKGLIHLTLIVKAGAVCEEENELGVAHIIEHLVLEGYGYSDPDALDYLQAFKHQCGAHQQALTLSDYTIYNFVVTNTVNLKKAIALMAAISRELDFTLDELEKEKRIVSQELWNDSQNIQKKHQLTFRTLLFQGTKYGEPVGATIKSIEDVSIDIVKGFYTKWYVPSNMAVIVVGDITETQNIIDLIKTYFERQPRGMPQHLEFPLPKHTEPRLIAHVDSALVKRRMSVVYVTFMFEKEGWKCVNDVFINIQRMLLQKVILGRLKKRFSSMSKPKQLQYSRDDSHMYTIYVVSVECEGYETNKVLETFLVEIARMRVHGINENELSEGKDVCLRIAKGRYLNHHERSSKQLRKNYTSHFVYNEADFSPKLEAQLMIALTKRINMELIKNFCEMQFAASNLSVIIFQSKTFVTQEEMKRSLQKITDIEKEGSFPSWSDEEMEGSTNLIQEMEIESGLPIQQVLMAPQNVDVTEESSAAQNMVIFQQYFSKLLSCFHLGRDIEPSGFTQARLEAGQQFPGDGNGNLSGSRQNWDMEFKDATSAAQAAAESAKRAFLAAEVAVELLRVTGKNLSVGGQNWDMNFKDAASAAQAAAESAERARLAASVVVELLRVTRQFSSDSQRSGVQSSGGGGPIHATGSTSTNDSRSTYDGGIKIGSDFVYDEVLARSYFPSPTSDTAVGIQSSSESPAESIEGSLLTQSSYSEVLRKITGGFKNKGHIPLPQVSQLNNGSSSVTSVEEYSFTSDETHEDVDAPKAPALCVIL